MSYLQTLNGYLALFLVQMYSEIFHKSRELKYKQNSDRTKFTNMHHIPNQTRLEVQNIRQYMASRFLEQFPD